MTQFLGKHPIGRSYTLTAPLSRRRRAGWLFQKLNGEHWPLIVAHVCQRREVGLSGQDEYALTCRTGSWLASQVGCGLLVLAYRMSVPQRLGLAALVPI